MFNFGLQPTVFSQYFTSTLVGDEELTTNEKKAASLFSGKRLKDFSTGRYCARKALSNVGYENAEILIGSNKQPVWPTGYVGSISHSGKLTGAVVARAADIKSIGLDIETVGKIKAEVWRLLYTPAEAEFLNNFTGDELAYYTTLLFSYKESFYKLQYPITSTFLEFTDVEVINFGSNFELRVLKEFNGKNLLPEKISFHQIQQNDQVVTVCYLD